MLSTSFEDSNVLELSVASKASESFWEMIPDSFVTQSSMFQSRGTGI